MFIPQPSPVILSVDAQMGTVCCQVTEPFPREDAAAEQLRADLLFSPSIFGELFFLFFFLLFARQAMPAQPVITPWIPSADAIIDKEGRVPTTEDTSSPQTFEQIRAWLDTCRKEHPWCREGCAPFLPTRLIYLDTTRTILQPRLVCTDSTEVSDFRYIALSYRWPQNSPAEAKLSRANSLEQMDGLKTSRLPQTFNDVFKVAARMGISYVWIDSLCIIQDDAEDWNREAARMVQIYRYAEFTVAADVPPTQPDLGLFRHGDPSDSQSVVLPGVKLAWTDQQVVFLRPQKVAYQESPLVSRGWCFQEREISRRIVHYTENQVLWECRTLQASEGSPYCLPYGVDDSWPERMFHGDLDGDSVFKAWHKAVEDYSARNLTVSTDKFPALSGLAAIIRDYQPADCRYLAGLWEHSFLEDLQWSSRSCDKAPTTNIRYPEYVAPTWSWASVAGPVSFEFAPYERHSTEDLDTDPQYTLKVLDICVQSFVDDPHGAVRHAVLTCTAGLLPGLLKGKSKESPGYSVETLNGKHMGEIYFDVDPQRYDAAEFEVLFCIHLGGPSTGRALGPGLAVQPTGNRVNEYRRVGLVPKLGFFYSLPDYAIKEITIV